MTSLSAQHSIPIKESKTLKLSESSLPLTANTFTIQSAQPAALMLRIYNYKQVAALCETILVSDFFVLTRVRGRRTGVRGARGPERLAANAPQHAHSRT